MKKSFLLLLSLFAIAWTIASCNKDQALVAPMAPPVRQQANAYENIGVQHNQALDYYLAHTDVNNPLPYVEDLVIEYGETQGYDRAAMQDALKDPALSAVIHSPDPAATVRKQYASNGQFLMVSYVDHMASALSNAADPAAARVQLEALEDKVQQDSNLRDDERNALLAGLAVAKHSGEYWYAQERLGAAAPWRTPKGTTGPTANRPWWKYALADAGGALGGIAGGWVGALTGAAVSTIEYALT